MKTTLYRALLLGMLCLTTTPLLAGEGKASLAAVSDYILRGASVSDHQPVVQGSYEYDYGNGITAGLWASTLPSDFEYDLTARYSGEAGDFGYSLGYVYYGYGKAAPAPAEFNLGLSYGDLSLLSSVGEGVSYNELSYTQRISSVKLRLHIGSNGTDPDYGLRLVKDLGGVELALDAVSRIDAATSVATDAYAVSLIKPF